LGPCNWGLEYERVMGIPSAAKGLRNPVDLRFQVHEAALGIHVDLGTHGNLENSILGMGFCFCLADGHPKKSYKNSMLPYVTYVTMGILTRMNEHV